MFPAWPSSGGSKDQGERMSGIGGALAPCPRLKSHPTENKTPEDSGRRRSTQGGRGRGTEVQMDPRGENTHGMTREWEKAEVGKGGGHRFTGHGGRHRHVERGAETNNGGWQVAGAGGVQVDCASLQERRWGAGARERGFGNKRY